MVTTPSIEVLELKGLMFRGLIRALRDYDPRRDSDLIDALMIFKIALYMLDGWEASTFHTQTLVQLEYQTPLSLGRLRDYPNTLVEDILMTVLSREMSGTEVAQCWSLVSTGLQLIRESVQYEIRKAEPVEPAVTRLRQDEWARHYENCLLECAHIAFDISDNGLQTERDLSEVGVTPRACMPPHALQRVGVTVNGQSYVAS